MIIRDNTGKFAKGHSGYKSWLGKSIPEEMRVKISKKLIGIKLSEETKNKMSLARKGKIPYWAIGKSQSDETRKKRSSSLKKWHEVYGFTKETKIKQSLAQRGSLGSNWKGGISPINKRIRRSIEFVEWRNTVFERDNYTCQLCGQHGGILHPHHIEKFSDNIDKRFSVENGITLCEFCHVGIVNYHEQEWINYFSQINGNRSQTK